MSWSPEINCYEPTLSQAADHCSRFVWEVQNRPARWLTLSGVTGCGKTMLAGQTFAEARKHNPHNTGIWVPPGGEMTDFTRRPASIWMTASQFAEGIRSEFKLPELLGQDFLVCIDDIGAARDTTNFIADGLYRLCNQRLGKWTIFTTNLSLPEIGKQIDERVASRLMRDTNVYHRITSGDYAMRRAGP